MNDSGSFQFIFYYLFRFLLNFLLSFWLVPNGLCHFLFIDLIPCLTRIWVLHVALPRTEIISMIYISSVLILVGCFGGGGVGWRHFG